MLNLMPASYYTWEGGVNLWHLFQQLCIQDFVQTIMHMGVSSWSKSRLDATMCTSLSYLGAPRYVGAVCHSLLNFGYDWGEDGHRCLIVSERQALLAPGESQHGANPSAAVTGSEAPPARPETQTSSYDARTGT